MNLDMYKAAIEPEETDMTFVSVSNVPSYTPGGKLNPLSEASTPIRAAIQPMGLTTTGQIMKDQPEGVRFEGYFMLWTRAAVPLKISDKIIYNGRTYRIVHLWPWQDDGFIRAGLGMLPL